jgi:hypothetical protein
MANVTFGAYHIVFYMLIYPYLAIEFRYRKLEMQWP